MIVEKARSQAAADIELLSKLDHPHVIKWLEVLEDKKNFYVVTEALLGGELLTFLSNRVSITESLACRVLSQVLLGLSYCHRQGVPHLSLHPNLLHFKSAPKDDVLHLKIAGFERARNFRAPREAGVSPYTAPEVYNGRAEAKSDTWSCGMLLYRILAGETAISATDYASVLTTGRTWAPTFSQRTWSAQVKALISSMLAWNWNARPDVADCLTHVWFTSNRPPLLLTSRGARSCLCRMLAVKGKRPLRDALKTTLIYRNSPELPLLIDVFTALDRDCDGLLDREDLREGLSGVIPSEQIDAEVSRLFSAMDKSPAESISYNEFLIAASSDKRLLAQENLLKVFTSLDREKRRQVSVDSLMHLFEWSAERERDRLWGELARQVKREAEEKLDFQEFGRVISRAVTGEVV
jgi:serine/threonine protein kinase